MESKRVVENPGTFWEVFQMLKYGNCLIDTIGSDPNDEQPEKERIEGIPFDNLGPKETYHARTSDFILNGNY